jgi:5'-nucleotidase
MQPFGNTLVTMTLTGAQLKALLESQRRGRAERPLFLQPSATLTYPWRDAAPAGSRVDEDSIVIEGRPWRRDATYRVTANSFLASGGDRFHVLLDGTDRDGGPLDVDALAHYLSQQSAKGPLPAPMTPRIVRRSDAATATQVR